jgi:transcriptional regulator with XRE-family HTH domain
VSRAADLSRSFGDVVRRERRRREWSLRDLAARTGISHGHLSMTERGRVEMAFGAAMKVASVLEIDLNALLDECACRTCHGVVPAGFACNACRKGAL